MGRSAPLGLAGPPPGAPPPVGAGGAGCLQRTCRAGVCSPRKGLVGCLGRNAVGTLALVVVGRGDHGAALVRRAPRGWEWEGSQVCLQSG